MVLNLSPFTEGQPRQDGLQMCPMNGTVKQQQGLRGTKREIA